MALHEARVVTREDEFMKLGSERGVTTTVTCFEHRILKLNAHYVVNFIVICLT